jgi:CelD/BcsL family acetyltransferase involved in cellulose biosynthesis
VAIDCLATPQLQVVLIRDEALLDAVADDWNRLARGVPFRRHEWLATWWRHFRRPTDQLFVPALYDLDGALVGLAPWYLSRDRWRGRVVRFLGSGKVCSEYLTLLSEPAAEQQVAARLADWLTIEHAKDWDLFDFDGIDMQDELLDQLTGRLSLAGYTVFRRRRERTWRLPLPTTWNELLGRLSKSRRTKIRAQDRKFFDSGRAIVRSAFDADSLREGLDVLHRLHQARRQSLGDDGCFTFSKFEAFLRDAAERFLLHGQLRLQWLEVDGRPAAVELDLLGDDALFYYQTGMDPDLAEISPGWLLQIASLKQAITDGLASFDFLRGDEAYKATWGAEARSLGQLRVAAKRPLARLRHELWLAALEAKQRWKKANGWLGQSR